MQCNARCGACNQITGPDVVYAVLAYSDVSDSIHCHRLHMRVPSDTHTIDSMRCIKWLFLYAWYDVSIIGTANKTDEY